MTLRPTVVILGIIVVLFKTKYADYVKALTGNYIIYMFA